MRSRVCCLLLAVMPHWAIAAGSSLGLSYVQTKDLTLVYFDYLDFLVPHAVRTYENSADWNRRILDWTPSERTMVLLRDHSDYGNAATATVPHDRIYVDIAPLSHAFETFPASERMYTLMNHELVHVTTGDAASDDDRRWRRLFFGKVAAQAKDPESMLYGYLTAPRTDVPRWYAEGIAVFLETWKDGGLGRAQGGYDEMVFRAMVRDDTAFYDPLGLVSRGVQTSFQTSSNAYLYGTRFFTWLAYRYSPAKVLDWVKRDDKSARYYADNFQRVFGLPLERAWQDWIAFEHRFQQENLASLRRYPITPYRKLAGAAMGSISRMYYDEDRHTIYAAFRYPGFVEHVGAVDTRDGTEKRLADIKGAMLYRVDSFAYDPASRTAFFTNNNLAHRDLMEVNVDTGEQRMLLEGARIGEIVFDPADRSLMGVRHAKGLAQLVRIPYPYTDWQVIHTFDYESVPYDLDVSPDGRLLSASMSDVAANQFVRVWELAKVLKGDMKPLSEFRFGQSIPESFVFSPDSRYLYGSSYYTGVSNIFRYEVATGKVEAVTNADIGFFRPVPLRDGRLVVLTYTGDGFVPAIIDSHPLQDVSAIRFLGSEVVQKYPVLKTWQVPPPGTVDYDKVVVKKGPYEPLKSIGLDNAYPTIQGYKNSVGIGYRFNFSDPVDLAEGGITVAYTPTGDLPGNERLHAEMSGEYLGWRGSIAWNSSDFYDLFGPTKVSRKGLAVKLGYDDLLIYDNPRSLTLSYDLEYFDKIDTLPNAQNVSTTFTRLATAQVGLLYSDLRRSQGAVDDEKGIAWGLIVKGNDAGGNAVGHIRGSLDYGIALPIAHSSIWLRTVAGASSGDRSDPVANFYFGAFGNNYVDHGTEKRYRDYDAFPGFGINEISGQSFARQMVEWNVPPVVLESAGTPGMYLNWLRPAVFASGLWTDPGDTRVRKTYADLGTQVDLRFHVLHVYDMTLSFGYAMGFQNSQRKGDEWMVSLKIL